MKRIICMLLVALLLLTGCQTAPPAETTAPEETTVPETTAPILVEQTAPIETMPDMTGAPMEGDELELRNPGKVRIGYTGSRSYVRYITSVDQLPDEEALKGYDEAFFEKSALLIVVDTVGSGSVQVEFDSVVFDGKTAGVSLTRTMPGETGTDDMATWLLWAEVDQGLDVEWVLLNASQSSDGEKY